MTEIFYLVQFIVGLVAIVKGADWLTDGSANVARYFGIPSIVVGLTIVAIGSSMPEFVVSVVSALQGNVDMALGNVVGSNIFNILGIIGLTALVKPIVVDRRNILYDVPFMVLSSLFIAITSSDIFLDGAHKNVISRTDGLLMLCTFAVFIFYTFSIIRGKKENGEVAEDANEPKPHIGKAALFIIVGLGLLIFGGEWLVDGASGIAAWMGVPDSIIALTIVSAGTSAPELAATLIAAKKGDTGLALGNIVGSVVFNVFYVLGVSATICPLGIGGVTEFDIFYLLGASVLMWTFCTFFGKALKITRIEGGIMVLAAIAYYTYLVINA